MDCDEERVGALVQARRRKLLLLSCVKEFSGDDLLSGSGIGIRDEDGDVEAGVAGTWLCTAAVEPAMSKLEGWPTHLELLLLPMLKDEEVWAPVIDEFIEHVVLRLLLMGMEEESGKLAL